METIVNGLESFINWPHWFWVAFYLFATKLISAYWHARVEKERMQYDKDSLEAITRLSDVIHKNNKFMVTMSETQNTLVTAFQDLNSETNGWLKDLGETNKSLLKNNKDALQSVKEVMSLNKQLEKEIIKLQ